MDTQGSEYSVMLGLTPYLLELPQCPRIILELTPFSLRQSGASGRALIELLAQLAQPFWIIDHIEHRLAACNEAELSLWCDNVDSSEGDQGCRNILIGAVES